MRLSLFVLVVALAGCRGPKGSPDSSIKSYYSAAAAQDYESLADTISQSSMKKLGSRAKAIRYFEGEYGYWKDADVSVDNWSVNADEKGATVTYTCVAHAVGNNYKVLNLDCSDTWSVEKEDDGKWHVVLPGAQRLRPVQ